MVVFYERKDIMKGHPDCSSGHVTYREATYQENKKIIYKRNKHGRPLLSRFEVAFSQLARLFLLPDLTSPVHLVVKDNKIKGVAVDNLCYMIAEKEGLTQGKEGPNKLFYTLNEPSDDEFNPSIKPTDTPEYYFLNKIPPGVLASLLKKSSAFRIDYDSLASIFATAYTLEEDDFHKGNYGFYLVKKDETHYIRFFKIDHDLMFVDSIMGFQIRRLAHWMHGAHAFDITIQDVRSLTCLKHASPFYWPTKGRYFSHFFDKKGYNNYADIKAFEQLGDDPEFIEAKWKSFCTHSLVSKELIKVSLMQHFDEKKATDRADVALITQATVARLARLRAVLFSIKEFRDFIRLKSYQEIDDLLKELIPAQAVNEGLLNKLAQSFREYKGLCEQENEFAEGDTPLHTAIKLGEYRYEETLNMFGAFLHTPNDLGETPLDIVLKRFDPQKNIMSTKMQNDTFSIMRHLLKNGATAPKTEKRKIALATLTVKTYTFDDPYRRKIIPGLSYDGLKEILRDIGEDHDFSLKSKKKLACECIKQFIEKNGRQPKFNENLQLLRNDINNSEQSPEVRYIQQLRSKLWLIRQIRGLYGRTRTQREINALISEAQKRHTQGFFSFFQSARSPEANKNADREPYGPKGIPSNPIKCAL